MLLILDDSIEQHYANLSEDQLDALSNIAISAREGNHFVIAKPALLDLLKGDDRLSIRERTLYGSVRSKYSTFSSVISVTDVRVVVKFDGPRSQSKDTNAAKTIIHLPLIFFKNSLSCRSTVLLCENLRDCFLYKHFANAYQKTRLNISDQFTLEEQGGGGRSIIQHINHFFSRDDRLFVTIVDSDQSTPQDGLGKTAELSRDSYNGYVGKFISALLILPAKKIENLLSDKFLENHLKPLQRNKSSLSFILNLDSDGLIKTRLYVEIKNTLKLTDILNKKNLIDFNSIWMPVLSRIENVFSGNCPSIKTCVTNLSCFHPSQCTCHLGDKSPNDLIDIARTSFDSNMDAEIGCYSTVLKNIVFEIGKFIFDWSFRGVQIRT